MENYLKKHTLNDTDKNESWVDLPPPYKVSVIVKVHLHFKLNSGLLINTFIIIHIIHIIVLFSTHFYTYNLNNFKAAFFKENIHRLLVCLKNDIKDLKMKK